MVETMSKRTERQNERRDYIKAHSKVYKILRYQKPYPAYDKQTNSVIDGEMYTDCFDTPSMYVCRILLPVNERMIFTFRFFSCTKDFQVYSDININDSKIRYLYQTPPLQERFKFDKKSQKNLKEITQKDLCDVANSDWLNHVTNQPTNILFMRQMFIKYINCCKHHKLIYWSKKQNRYIPYNLYEFLRDRYGNEENI